jgi:hypothetical protein
VRIEITQRAQEQFAHRDAWWRAKRSARELFIEEYQHALEHLSTAPKSGDQYCIIRGKVIRRWLMKKTECHIYYWYSEELNLIEIRAFWGAKRGHGPTFLRR